MYPSSFQKTFRLLVWVPANQQTKWWQMMAELNRQFAMYRRFFSVNTLEMQQKCLMPGVKGDTAVPEKHIINFFDLIRVL